MDLLSGFPEPAEDPRPVSPAMERIYAQLSNSGRGKMPVVELRKIDGLVTVLIR